MSGIYKVYTVYTIYIYTALKWPPLYVLNNYVPEWLQLTGKVDLKFSQGFTVKIYSHWLILDRVTLSQY